MAERYCSCTALFQITVFFVFLFTKKQFFNLLDTGLIKSISVKLYRLQLYKGKYVTKYTNNLYEQV